MSGIDSTQAILPIPGFAETDWLFVTPSGCEDPETGEWLSGGPPGYLKRYIRVNAFPDAPDGKTGAADSIFIPLEDLQMNDAPEQIAALIVAQRELVEMSLRDLFAQKGVAFPE